MKYTTLILSAALATATFASPASDAAALLERYNASYVTNGIYTMRDYDKIVKVCSTNSAIAAEVDALLSQKPTVWAVGVGLRGMFPVTTEVVLARLEPDYPVFVAKYRNKNAMPGIPAGTQYVLEFVSVHGWVPQWLFERWRAKALDYAKKHVVRKMRSEGLSVVGEQGRAVMQQRLDAVATAFDAPMFNGMSNALSACGMDIKVPTSYPLVPQGEKLARLMDAVYNGDVRFGDRFKGYLRAALGLEEYNKFLERYNGGTK